MHSTKICHHVRLDLLERQITSFSKTNITSSKTDRRQWHFYLPIGPAPSHPHYPEPLCLENNARMRSPSYINTRHCHKVSLTLLEHYDRNELIPSRRLTPESLGRVRTKCGLLPLQARRLDDMSAATFDVFRNTDRQPLFLPPPLPTTSRPEPSPIQNPSVQFPRVPLPLQHSYFLEEISSSNSHKRPKISLPWTLLSTLFALILLCLCATLLGLLGYSFFLGIAWLLRGLTSLLIAIKADFVALGHWIVGIGRVISSPFMAVGRGITAVVQEVVKVVREIVRWVRQVRGHV
jgi:hypothetical protein